MKGSLFFFSIFFVARMEKNKNEPSSPTPPVSKPEKKEPLSLEELLARKQAEELARSKVSVCALVAGWCRILNEPFVNCLRFLIVASVPDKRTEGCRSSPKETRRERAGKKKTRRGTKETVRILTSSRWWRSQSQGRSVCTYFCQARNQIVYNIRQQLR